MSITLSPKKTLVELAEAMTKGGVPVTQCPPAKKTRVMRSDQPKDEAISDAAVTVEVDKANDRIQSKAPARSPKQVEAAKKLAEMNAKRRAAKKAAAPAPEKVAASVKHAADKAEAETIKRAHAKRPGKTTEEDQQVRANLKRAAKELDMPVSELEKITKNIQPTHAKAAKLAAELGPGHIVQRTVRGDFAVLSQAQFDKVLGKDRPIATNDGRAKTAKAPKARAATKEPKKVGEPKGPTKNDQIIELAKRPGGTDEAAMFKVTGWTSGSGGGLKRECKKRGIALTIETGKDGEKKYFIRGTK